MCPSSAAIFMHEHTFTYIPIDGGHVDNTELEFLLRINFNLLTCVKVHICHLMPPFYKRFVPYIYQGLIKDKTIFHIS